MKEANRPLSPHLQVYRWKIHMALSILHRATGVFLGAGVLFLAAWLISVATGPEAFNVFQGLASHFLGRLILFGFTFALILHLLNGIRHLFWDIGKGFALDTVRKTGWLVVVLAILVTIGIWLAGYYVAGTLGM